MVIWTYSDDVLQWWWSELTVMMFYSDGGLNLQWWRFTVMVIWTYSDDVLQ